MKKSDRLDEIIKQKLEQLQPAYRPDAWKQFEQRLDAQGEGTPPAPDRRLDEIVFAKIHGLESRQPAANWELLAAKLDEDSKMRRQHLRSRIMQTALVLLILFTFVQYFGQQTPAALRFAPRSSDALSATELRQVKPTVPAKDLHSAALSLTDKAIDTPLLSAASSDADAPRKPYQLSPRLKSVPTAPQSAKQPDAIANPMQHPAETDVPKPVERELFMVALEKLVVTELEKSSLDDDYPKLIQVVKPRSGFYVSMFGSMDYNHIITPAALHENGQLLDEGFERYALGYGGGVMLGWETGRWEIGTGAIYTAKEYTPRPLVYLNGSFREGYYGESFDLVELNMLQVPLQLRYNVIKKNKWRAFVTSGVSLQVALQANYYISESEAVAMRQSSPPPRPAPGGSFVSPADEKARILSRGFLEGGTLLENGYITGNIGIGLEYFITERWGVFTQPTYQRSIDYFTKGFGPDQDRLNTMSIFTGVRVKL